MNNQLFNNTLYSALDKIIVIIIGFVFVAMMVTQIGADQYGVYLILSMLSITGALNIFDLGLEISVQYYISYYGGNRFRQKMIIIYSVLLYLVLGTLFSILLYLLSSQLASTIDSEVMSTDVLAYMLKIISINLFFQFIMIALKAILEGARFFYLTKILNSISLILQSVAIIFIVSVNHDLTTVFEIILGVTILKIVVLLYWIKKHLKHNYFDSKLGNKRNLLLLRKIIKYSLDVLGSRLVGFIFNQTDKLLIWKFLTPMWMTIYDIVTKPIMPLRMVIQILNTALVPEIAFYHKKQEYKNILNIYTKFVEYSYLIIFPISFILLFYIDIILNLWIGEEYGKYNYLSIIVIFTYILLPISAISGTIIAGLKAVNKILIVMTISAFINLILSVIFIDSIGIKGLLLATLIAEYYLVIPYNSRLEELIGMKSYIYKKVLKIFWFHTPLITLLIILKLLVINPLVGICVALCFMIIQFYVNYKFLLDSKEQEFLLKKF